MGSRREAREVVLQVFFQYEYSGDIGQEELGGMIQWPQDSAVSAFASMLCRGILENLADIDSTIMQNSTNWTIGRMGLIDRNILRLAVFELQYVDDIPPRVTINEAIEIAKKYGDQESSSFINGILDKILQGEKVKQKTKINADKGSCGKCD